jgi:rhodanese-related sulfurtransferase
MRVLALALSLLAFTFVSCTSEAISTVVAPSVDTLNADEIKALVEQPDGVVFVDVRTPREIQQTGTLNGALLIPIDQFQQRMSEIPKDKKVVVACARGARAGRGASLLKKSGYGEVYSVGLNEYAAKGYPLIKP